MSCQLDWIVSLRTSAAYAAATLLAGGQPADSSRTAVMHELVNDLCRRAGCYPREMLGLLSHITPLSADAGEVRLLVRTGLGKLGSWDAGATGGERLSEALQDFFENWALHFPAAEHELNLRRKVFEENWSARGPGLMAAIGRFTDESLIAPRASVLVVEPLLGGGGTAYLAYNAVAIEGVLANPCGDLPEIVRLAWLLAELQLEAPIHSETVHGSRLPLIAALAMVPPTLQAASVVELADFSPVTVQRAIEVWQIPVEDRAATAEGLLRWWDSYSRERPRWPVALAALERLLA